MGIERKTICQDGMSGYQKRGENRCKAVCAVLHVFGPSLQLKILFFYYCQWKHVRISNDAIFNDIA